MGFKMTEYIILFAIMLVIYFVLVRNKPAAKTDWEGLPLLDEYLKNNKAKDEQGTTQCIYCANQEILKKPLRSEKENPQGNKFYHACSECKVILWRSES